ncbi:myb-related transcription factor, partner of profilin-like [Pleurodeles waltl]|uniref:myb-related transcription factor, partner of profilin-like n=1 Tax=Pleurodeles waltl TaxID=8319 RepID=UPI0037093983
MENAGQETPHRDPNQTSTNQDGPAKPQGKEQSKRKCCFSEEKNDILVREVTEHQHQLFVISKLSISRKEAVCQSIFNKVNSVTMLKRSGTDCKTCWHNCKGRSKEKLSRNQKAELQTVGESPAPQEDLNELKDMVTVIIAEELVTGVAEQDSADFQDLPQMQEDEALAPAELPVLDCSDDVDDQLPTIDAETLQEVLCSFQTSSLVTGRTHSVTGSPHEPPNNQHTALTSPAIALDSEDPDITFQRTTLGVQWELAQQVRVGMETMAGSLEGVQRHPLSSTWTRAVLGPHSCCPEAEAGIIALPKWQQHD